MSVYMSIFEFLIVVLQTYSSRYYGDPVLRLMFADMLCLSRFEAWDLRRYGRSGQTTATSIQLELGDTQSLPFLYLESSRT